MKFNRVYNIGNIPIKIEMKTKSVLDTLDRSFFKSNSDEYEYSFSISEPENDIEGFITVRYESFDGSFLYKDTFVEGHVCDFFLGQMFPIMLRTYKKYLMLHATGIHKDNVIYILINKSGSGKTTFSLQSIIFRDFSFFSDDSIIYDMENDTFYPVSKVLHIKKDTMRLFGMKCDEKKISYKTGGEEYAIFTIDEFFEKTNSNRIFEGNGEGMKFNRVYLLNTVYSSEKGFYIYPLAGIAKYKIIMENCANVAEQHSNILNILKNQWKDVNVYKTISNDFSEILDQVDNINRLY